MSIRICVKCNEEYKLYRGKPGFINECGECGLSSEEGMTKLGGIMEYSHKTAPTIKIVALKDAKEIIKKTKRKSGTSIISGMSRTR